MPTPLELRLHQIAFDFAREIAGIISGMTIEDLAALRGDDDAPKPKTRRKTRTSQKPAGKKRTAPTRKTTRKHPATKPAPEATKSSEPGTEAAPATSNGQQEPQGQSISSMLIRHSPQGDGGPSMPSTPAEPAPTQSRHVPAEALAKAGSPQGDGGPPPTDHAAAFRRAEQERLETAVVKFVSQNPETDAEIVNQRLGLQKGKAQEVLDDLVLKGRLGMKSGQHGRCYVVVE